MKFREHLQLESAHNLAEEILHDEREEALATFKNIEAAAQAQPDLIEAMQHDPEFAKAWNNYLEFKQSALQ
jgi:hypothetical protein